MMTDTRLIDQNEQYLEEKIQCCSKGKNLMYRLKVTMCEIRCHLTVSFLFF